MLIERVEFGVYVCYDVDCPKFQNRMLGKTWPIFRRVPKKFRRKRRHWSFRSEVISRGIDRSAKIAAARRWIPMNPLFAHVLSVNDRMRRR